MVVNDIYLYYGNATAPSLSNGTATLTVIGGTPGYTENWGTENPMALLAGTYTSINGYPWAGSFIGAGGVIGLVSAFVVGRKNAPDNNAKQHSKEVITTQKK